MTLVNLLYISRRYLLTNLLLKMHRGTVNFKTSYLRVCRSGCSEMFYKKDVLKNFAKATWEHLCQSLFVNKVAGLRPVTLFKKRLCHRCFLVNFKKILRLPFFIEHLLWLVLSMIYRSSPLHCQIRSVFCSIFSRIRTECKDLWSKYPYSNQIRGNKD